MYAIASLLLFAAAPAAVPADVGRMVVLADFGLGAPTGIIGIRGGGWTAAGIGLEAGYGKGATGHQLALLGRYQFVRSDEAGFSWSVGCGPSLALAGTGVNHKLPHRLDRASEGLFYALWWNAEIAVELRTRPGLFLRGGLGVAVTLHENMSPLCTGVSHGAPDNPSNEGCDPPHWAPPTEIAAKAVLPYFTSSIGWSF